MKKITAKYYVIFALTLSAVALAAPSSNRTIILQFIKNGTSVLTVPSSGNDVLVARATTDTFTNKSMDGGSNTFTNLPASGMTGQIPVANGGTGLASGTSGGVLAYTASGTLASSGALTANQLIKGGGAGAAPLTLAAGSQYQALVMGATTPGYGSLDLSQSAAVTNQLTVPNGGTGIASATAYGTIVAGTTSTGAFQVVAPGASGAVLTSGGASAVPAYTALVVPTVTAFTSGAGAGQSATTQLMFFHYSTITTPPSAATYTNNAVTYTFVSQDTTNKILAFSITPGSTPTVSGTTLTKASGTGDATITIDNAFSQTAGKPQLGYIWTPLSTTKMVKATICGGGGAGGGATTGAAGTSSAGGGGQAGSCAQYWFVPTVNNVNVSYYFTVGPGGTAGAAGNTAGNAGGFSYFATSLFGTWTSFNFYGGGNGGSSMNFSASIALANGGSSGAGGSGPSGAYFSSGQVGFPGVVYSTVLAQGGAGGSSPFASGGAIINGSTGNGGFPGAGGAGGMQINGGASVAGGTGGAGSIIFEEYQY